MVGMEGAERAAASEVTIRSGLGASIWTGTRPIQKVEPNREQWLALHHAFRRYCEARPWERLANEDVLAVNDPLGYFKGHCVALPVGAEALERGLALSAVLGDREELDNGERKAMRDLGLRYRGRGRWPIFRSIVPGCWPWYLSGDEARFLTIALDNVWDVAERMGHGMIDLYAGRDPSEVLTRSLPNGAWQDGWEPLKPLPLPVEEHPVDTDRLRTISGSAPAGSAMWEATASYIPTGAGRKWHKALPAHAGYGDRARLRVDTHGADAGAGSDGGGEAGTGAEVAGAGGPVAGRVVCDREDTAALDIGWYVGPTPELDLIKDDLLATVLR